MDVRTQGALATLRALSIKPADISDADLGRVVSKGTYTLAELERAREMLLDGSAAKLESAGRATARDREAASQRPSTTASPPSAMVALRAEAAQAGPLPGPLRSLAEQLAKCPKLNVFAADGNLIFSGNQEAFRAFRFDGKIGSIEAADRSVRVRFGPIDRDDFAARKWTAGVRAVIEQRAPEAARADKPKPEPLTDDEISEMFRRAYAREKGEANIEYMVRPAPLEVGQYFDAHGLAKVSLAFQFRELHKLLTVGLDPNRPFFSAPLEVPPGAGAGYGTAGGAYNSGSFIMLGAPGKAITDGIKYVIVNGAFGDEIPRLQKAYPHVEFIRTTPYDDTSPASFNPMADRLRAICIEHGITPKA